jgi:hypothetical protein
VSFHLLFGLQVRQRMKIINIIANPNCNLRIKKIVKPTKFTS